MITLYGYTILVDLALLAIMIAIFLFVVTIYKGASELCIKEAQNASNRRKELIEGRKTELTQKIPTINGNSFSNEVRAEIDKLDNEILNIDKSVLNITNKAKLLTAKNLIFIPSSLLIVSIIASGIAIVISGNLQPIIWILSLLLLAASLYFICRCICAMEYFSSSIDLSTLMEQALDRHTDKLKPVVDMEIWDFQLEIAHGESEQIEYCVFLKKGPIGRNTTVRFLATDELDFPAEKTEILDVAKNNMNNPKWFTHKIGDINPNVNKVNEFKVKAPDAPGEYIMSYWLMCDEYTGEETTFKIKVT